MNASRKADSTTRKIPVYEVRLVASRRPLRLAEECLPDPRACVRALHALIGMADREHFVCLFVNTAQRVTGAHIAAIGAQHAIAGLDARVVLRAALAACANAMIVAHNHPSGDPSPSAEDLSTTASLMRAANLIGIPILDHIIVTRDPQRYHSMYERGTLPVIAE